VVVVVVVLRWWWRKKRGWEGLLSRRKQRHLGWSKLLHY